MSYLDLIIALPGYRQTVLSDECEPVSIETMALPFMPYRVDATQRERRRGWTWNLLDCRGGVPGWNGCEL